MGKVTIIVESDTTPTRELDAQCHKILHTMNADYIFPEDVEVFIVPSDEEEN